MSLSQRLKMCKCAHNQSNKPNLCHIHLCNYFSFNELPFSPIPANQWNCLNDQSSSVKQLWVTVRCSNDWSSADPLLISMVDGRIRTIWNINVLGLAAEECSICFTRWSHYWKKNIPFLLLPLFWTEYFYWHFSSYMLEILTGSSTAVNNLILLKLPQKNLCNYMCWKL